MKKLETKLATVTEDKDKRIVELQAHNNDLFNKLEEFEERYNNQLDVSRWSKKYFETRIEWLYSAIYEVVGHCSQEASQPLNKTTFSQDILPAARAIEQSNTTGF